MEAESMSAFLGSPLVMMFIILPIFLVPFWRIVKRTGHSGWWSVIAFIPFANLVGVWLLAFVRWPAIDDHKLPCSRPYQKQSPSGEESRHNLSGISFVRLLL
jgi:hypothetical protein